MALRLNFIDYVKSALLNHWNLLALGGGLVGGLLSGHADIAVPLLLAAEVTYLAGLASHDKFQRHVDAQAHKAARAMAAQERTEPALGRMFAALDPASRARFEALRRRARDLRKLAADFRPGVSAAAPIEDLQGEAVNKLLWIFLKLLYSRHAVARFIAGTAENMLRGQIAEMEAKLARLGDPTEDTPQVVRARRSLSDTLASANLRLQNLNKAKENHLFLELEADRLEQKIISIAELSVNRQDPDFISSEVDGVAATMEHTEAAINDLHLLDIEESDAPPPSFLDREFVEHS